jgi:hypothetical protein
MIKPMNTISDQGVPSRRYSPNIKSSGSQLLRIRQQEINLWENPPEASPAMKQAISKFKDRVKNNEKWDGNFSL